MARVRAAAVRSRLVLELALGLIDSEQFSAHQAKVLLRPQGFKEWELSLFGSDAPPALQDVAYGKATLGIVNPSAVLTLASRGVTPFRGPLPLRAIGVVPSEDQLVFAVHRRTGLNSLDEVALKQYPLRVSLRGQRDHSVHLVLDHVLQATGWSLADVVSWGGEVRYDEGTPARGSRLEDVRAGTVDAIFDEAASSWVEQALNSDMQILSIPAPALARLEAWGYRRALMRRDAFPSLPSDLSTVDFSGFAVYVHENAAADLVQLICQALENRSDRIYVQSGEPLAPVAICGNTRESPLDVPFHEAAAAYWRAKGYI